MSSWVILSNDYSEEWIIFFLTNSFVLSAKDCLGLFCSGDISGPGVQVALTVKVENNPQSFSMSSFCLFVGHLWRSSEFLYHLMPREKTFHAQSWLSCGSVFDLLFNREWPVQELTLSPNMKMKMRILTQKNDKFASTEPMDTLWGGGGWHRIAFISCS